MRKRKAKRYISLLLALTMAISMASGGWIVTARAEETQGTETTVPGTNTEDSKETGNLSVPAVPTNPEKPSDPVVSTNPEKNNSSTTDPVAQVQKMIDALPDGDEITADNANEVETQLTAIDEARAALSDEEMDALDATRYMAAVAALNALNGQEGAGEPAPLANYVATVKVDGVTTSYETIQAAFEAADGKTATITLLTNITGLTTALEISGANSDITFEGGDYVLSGENSPKGGVIEVSGGELTVISGSIAETSYYNGVYVSGGKVTVQGGAVSGGVGIYVDGGTVDIQSGSVTGTNSLNAYGVQAENNSTVTVSGGTVSGRNTNQNGYGLSARDSTATITGGTITGNGKSNGYGLFAFGSTVTIEGGTFTGTGANNGFGLDAFGGTVTISGGTFTGDANINVNKYAIRCLGITVRTLLKEGYAYYKDSVSKDTKITNTSQYWIKGTVIVAEENPATPVATVKISDGTTTTYRYAEDGIYTTAAEALQAAWTAAQGASSATVTLLMDVDLGKQTFLEVGTGADITLQMNEGVTLTGNSTISAKGIIYVTGGSFTLASGGISATATYGRGVYVFSGTAEIKGGTITATGSSGNCVRVKGGSATVSGGTLTANNSSGFGVFVDAGSATITGNADITGYQGGLYVKDGSSARVEGGTISATYASGDGAFVRGTLTVTGGLIQGTSNGVQVSTNGHADIYGGTIRSTGTNTNYGLNVASATGSATISGGTFSGQYAVRAYSTKTPVTTLLDTTREGKHFAYYKGETVSADNLITDAKKLAENSLDASDGYGTVTVGECIHSWQGKDNQNGTHDVTCTVCGAGEQAQTHTWGEWTEDTENGGMYHKCTVCNAKENAVASVTTDSGTITYGYAEDGIYETPAAALKAAWKAGQEADSAKVTLLMDVKLGNTKDDVLTISAGDDITLTGGTYTDGDGQTHAYTLSGGPTSFSTGMVYVNGGKFTLDGGSLSKAEERGVYVASGSFVMKGGAIKADTYGVYLAGGSFRMEDGTIEATDRFSAGVCADKGCESFTMTGGTLTGYHGASLMGGTANITGGTVSGTYSSLSIRDAKVTVGGAANISCNTDYCVTVSNGSLTVQENAQIKNEGAIGLQASGTAQVAITGGTVSGASKGMSTWIGSPTITVNGGQIKGTTGVGLESGSTFVMTGGEISGSDRSYGIAMSGGTATIYNGTITGYTGLSVGGGTANISGGTFTADSMGLSIQGAGNVAVSGGSFSGEHGLYVWSGGTGTVALSGGTYIGTSAGAAVYNTVSDGTVEDLLATQDENGNAVYYGYYYPDGTVEWKTAVQKLSGTVTVKNVTLRITQQPKNETIPYGTDTGLTVEAKALDGSSPLTYQWYRVNGDGAVVPVTNGTGAKLTVSGLSLENYTYYCDVTCGGLTVSSDTATVTVKKAVITDISTTTKSVTPPAALAEVQSTVTAGSGYSAQIAWDCEKDVYDFNTSYTATLTLTPDGNHEFADNIKGADGWTVTNTDGVLTLEKTFPVTRLEKIKSVTAPADVALNSHMADADAVIQTLPDTVKVVLEKNGTVDLDIEWSCENYNAAPAADNTFTWTVPASETDQKFDRSDISLTGTITVANPEAQPVNIRGQDTTVTYDGSEIGLASLFTIDENAGVASYTVENGTGAGDVENGKLTVTRAGTFTVTVKTAAKGIYAPGEKSVTLTVNKGIGSGTVNIKGWTYGDTANTPVPASATNGTEDVEYKYESLDGTYDSANAPAGAGSYRVTASFAETDLYQATTASAEFTIAKKEIEAKVTAQDKTYDGNTDAVVTAIVDTGIDGEELTVSGLTGTFADANAGTNKAVAVHTDGLIYGGTADPANYVVNFPETVRADITTADMAADVAGYSDVYDGASHGITVTPSEKGASVRFGTEEGTYDKDEVAYTDAGTYTVYYQVTKDNYTTVTGSATVEIEKRPVTVTANSREKTYSETDPELTYTASGLVKGDALKGKLSREEGEDAGVYAITQGTLTDADNPNYRITFRGADFTIQKAGQDAPSLTVVNESICGKGDGAINGLTTAMEISSGGESYVAVTDPEMAFAAGTYHVRYAADGNHDASSDTVVTVKTGRMLTVTFKADDTVVTREVEWDASLTDIPDIPAKAGYDQTAPYWDTDKFTHIRQDMTVTAVYTINTYSVTLPENTIGYVVGTEQDGTVEYDGSFTFTVSIGEGYSEAKDFAVMVNGETLTPDENGSYTISNIRKDIAVTVEGVADLTPPDVEVAIGDNKWNSFWNTVTFGLFFKETQSVAITAEDIGSGVGRVYYFLAEEELSLDEVKAISEWTEYTGTFNIDPDHAYIIYVKVVDNAGNTVYVNSGGVVLDAVAPVISGIENNGVYYGDTTFTAEDTCLDTVSVDGGEAALEDGRYVIPADNKEHTILVTDKAGNQTGYTVTVYKVYTVTYIADGKVVSTQRVGYGKDAQAPAIPEKDGYKQTAPVWDKDGKNITDDVIITAVYTADPAEPPVTEPSDPEPPATEPSEPEPPATNPTVPEPSDPESPATNPTAPKPSNPESPATDPAVTEPSKPELPVQGSSETESTAAKPAASENKGPKTGDSTAVWPWFALIFASCAGMAGTAVHSSRKKKKAE